MIYSVDEFAARLIPETRNALVWWAHKLVKVQMRVMAGDGSLVVPAKHIDDLAFEACTRRVDAIVDSWFAPLLPQLGREIEGVEVIVHLKNLHRAVFESFLDGPVQTLLQGEPCVEIAHPSPAAGSPVPENGGGPVEDNQ
jgi:hypothetical protein